MVFTLCFGVDSRVIFSQESDGASRFLKKGAQHAPRAPQAPPGESGRKSQ